MIQLWYLEQISVFFSLLFMCICTLRAESPSIFLDKSGRGRNPLPDLSRKIEGDSARRVVYML